MTPIDQCLINIGVLTSESAYFDGYSRLAVGTLRDQGEVVDEVHLARIKVKNLQKSVRAAEMALDTCSRYISERDDECDRLKTEMVTLKSEADQAHSALEAALSSKDKDAAKSAFITYASALDDYNEDYRACNGYIKEIEKLGTVKTKCNKRVKTVREKYDAAMKQLNEAINLSLMSGV